MFCLAKVCEDMPAVPSIILDYEEYDEQFIDGAPPGLRLESVLKITSGSLPIMTLVHFDDNGIPETHSGTLHYSNEDFFLIQENGKPSIKVDINACQLQNNQVQANYEDAHDPSYFLELSNHSQKPIMRRQSSSIGALESKHDDFNGLKFAKEWMGHLCVLHHLTTKAIFEKCRNPDKKYIMHDASLPANSDELFLWWPTPLPWNLCEFLKFLVNVDSKMDGDVLNLYDYLPCHSGFFSCILSQSKMYLNGENFKHLSLMHISNGVDYCVVQRKIPFSFFCTLKNDKTVAIEYEKRTHSFVLLSASSQGCQDYGVRRSPSASTQSSRAWKANIYKTLTKEDKDLMSTVKNYAGDNLCSFVDLDHFTTTR